jgi:formate dehydrogenase iron-sulfur subunit
MLVDVTRCIGCRACQVACKQWNGLPADQARVFQGTYQSSPDLQAGTYTVVKFFESGGQGPEWWNFRKHQCLHCGDAVCVKVCPKGAIGYLPNGIVHRNAGLCIGCGYCAQYCPFEVPRVDPVTAKATHCTFCEDRVAANIQPACAQACPTGAISVGPRNDLVNRGLDRVAFLRQNGNAQAVFYGGTDIFGGTHVMYVLSAAPENFALPRQPRTPDSVLVWREFVKPFGAILVGGALVLSLAGYVNNWCQNRKREIAQEGGKSLDQ